MKELMIQVERIVRPVRADWSKLKMRHELLAHLQASFDEKRAAGLDEATALAEAKCGLGEPAALTRELQASVSKLERLVVTPFPRVVPKVLIAAAVLLPAAFAIAPAPARLAATAAPHARLLVGASALAMEVSILFWYASIIATFRRHVRWTRAIVAGVFGFVVQFAAMELVMFALAGRFLMGDVRGTLYAAILVPVFFAFTGMMNTLAKRPLRQWLELEIAV